MAKLSSTEIYGNLNVTKNITSSEIIIADASWYPLKVISTNNDFVGGVGQWSTWKKAALLDANNNLTMASKVYNAVYNDYAEWFERENINEKLEPGDVLVWGENGVTKCFKKNDTTIVGVYSDSYGHIVGGKKLDNMEDNIKEFVPIGLCGRVLVKVIGKVEEGDMIVSSDIPGVGMSAKEFKMGTIIGKAVQNKNTEEIGKVKIIICLS